MSESRPAALTPTPQAVLSGAVVEALHKAYDTGDWLDWRRTPQGSTNISFFVTASSGRYVLRCSTARKSLDAIRFEVRLIEYLRARDYPAPAIIRTRRVRTVFFRSLSLLLLPRTWPNRALSKMGECLRSGIEFLVERGDFVFKEL